jgi:hypothetical protein
MNYKNACSLRDAAERNTDPELYIIAARAFGMLGMSAAELRCLDRASYYAAVNATVPMVFVEGQVYAR